MYGNYFHVCVCLYISAMFASILFSDVDAVSSRYFDVKHNSFSFGLKEQNHLSKIVINTLYSQLNPDVCTHRVQFQKLETFENP